MGLIQTTEALALIEAKKIREDLYNRVQVFQAKNKYLYKQIPCEQKKLITTSSAFEIVQMLDQHQTTCLTVMLSFIERTATVGVSNNYVLDEMFDQAIIEAKRCDQIRAQNKDKKSWKPGMQLQECFPPYFGVPISIKESILMKGKQTYVGFVSRLNPIPEQDSMMIEMVKNMGFIPFVRSNVPQGVKTIQTNNNIFGYAKNPWNTTRSTGGSSGGEGGLVASYCTPIGLGSDIGGSLRVPADWNGLFTLKANGRISKIGNAYCGKFAGGSPVRGAIGFLTRGTDDLIITTSYLCDEVNYGKIPKSVRDPYVFLKKLDTDIFQKKPNMKIGYLTHLKTVHCSLTHQRAVLESKEIFESLGHEVVKVQLPNFQKLYLFLVMLNTCDGSTGVFDELRKGEPYIKQYRMLALMMKIPWIVRKIIIWIIKKKMPRVALILENTRKRSARELLEEIYEAQHVTSRKIYQVFAQNNLDAILMPGFSVPAVKSGDVAGLQYCYPYVSGWNALSYPVGSVPITTVRRDETTYSDIYEDVYTNNMRKSLKESVGLPAGVQIVSLPFNQQSILYLMNQLEKAVHFRQKHRPPY